MNIKKNIAEKLEKEAERVEKARSEFNFKTLEPFFSRGLKVLDVGAWNCYLGQLLKDRLASDVLSLDVVNVNKTDMPFQIFDGKTLPVTSESFDTVLLLYVLHHAEDDRPLLEESNRALKNGGRLFVAEDSIDGLWNKILTVGFHIWLRLIAGMPRGGKFRTVSAWNKRFQETGFEVEKTVYLGHHLGRLLWPKNVLFVLKKREKKEAS